VGDFRRIELFTPREKRALVVCSVALLAILLGAVIYTHPVVIHPATVAARTPRPTPTPIVYVNVGATSPETAYIQTFASIDSSARPLGSYRTDNGGRSWQRFQTPRGDGCPLGLVPGPTKDDVVMIGCYGGGGWISHDGGRQWQELKAPSVPVPGGGFWLVPHTSQLWFSWFGQSRALVYRSPDLGATWQQVIDIEGGLDIRSGASFEFAGDSLWLLTTAPNAPKAQLYRSSGDGKSWQAIALPTWPTPPRGNLAYVPPSFTTPTHGYLLVLALDGQPAPGFSGPTYVSTTDDGGTTWSRVRALDHYPIATLTEADDWWATDGTTVFRSPDFGVTWSATRATLPKGERLQQIIRVTPDVAWNVIGNFNTFPPGGSSKRIHLMRTTDGARTWKEVKFPTS
jgi:photosystem II stability/assembly factor-like uncharacterized protein